MVRSALLNPASANAVHDRARWPMVGWRELLSLVLEDLERSRRRTFLTILGLVIGAASVVAVTSVGLAGRDYALAQLENLGTNFIWVSYSGPAGAASGTRSGSPELDEYDFERIRDQASALAAVTRVLVLFTAISSGGRPYPVSLVGTDGSFARVRNLSFDEGRPLAPEDVTGRRKVCVLEQSLAAKLYGRRSALGSSLKVEDFNFEVVGVFRDVHTPGVETELSRDAVLIPISVARFFTSDNSVDTIYAQARSRESISAAVAEIRDVLARHHGRSDLYPVNTLSYFVEVVHRISVALMGIVVVLALIAMMVGGVGIFNIMLITVSERTREVGVRVALGARRSEILRLFFMEALVISVIGGVVGILLGCLGPLVVHVVVGFPMPVSLMSVAVALVVSVVVGVGFGIAPARRAAALNPVEALRYE
jgi:putative ABC transport system permease protein